MQMPKFTLRDMMWLTIAACLLTAWLTQSYEKSRLIRQQHLMIQNQNERLRTTDATLDEYYKENRALWRKIYDAGLQ